MAPTLRFSSLFLLTASWMLAAGCGDDDAIVLPTGSSGQAGAGAQAGSSGSGAHAGATGGAGKAGSSAAGSSAAGSSEAGFGGADTGGEPGEGGAPPSSGGTSGGGTSGGATAGGGGATAGTGGTAGGGGATAGTGGTAGGGGATAGTGGTAGGGGATAGTGGTAGGGGASNALKTCAHSCATDDDCKVTGEADQSHFCNPTRKRCEDTSVCRTTADCVGFASGWYGSCQADSDCQGQGDVCVALGSRGACAMPPDPTLGCAYANGPDSVPATVARFGSAATVEVCASPDAVCVGTTCQPTCDSQSGTCGGTTTCNTSTGLCDCSSSGQCDALSSSPVCGADAHCGCATSDQCAPTAGRGFDHCYSGTCGCSSTAACPASQFKNAPPVCE